MNTSSLFQEMEDAQVAASAPLAVRMRPRTLDEVCGQADAIGPSSWLRQAIQADSLSSVILYGPAGTGKTSIAHVIAKTTDAHFVEVSAIGGTVSDLRREIKEADARLRARGERTILFVDEIHRLRSSRALASCTCMRSQMMRYPSSCRWLRRMSEGLRARWSWMRMPPR